MINFVKDLKIIYNKKVSVPSRSLSTTAVPLTDELLSLLDTSNDLSLSGSFKLCLDDGSRIEGTYKINIEAKLCMVSVHDIADKENIHKSKRNGEGIECCNNTPDSLDTTTNFDKSTDEDTGQSSISMARIVINILSAISVKRSESQKPSSAGYNQFDKNTIETDGGAQQSECRSMDKRQTFDHAKLLSCTKNIDGNAKMIKKGVQNTSELTIISKETQDVLVNNGNTSYSNGSKKLSYNDAIGLADAMAQDELNAHQKGIIPYTRFEQNQISTSLTDDSLSYADGNDHKHDGANLAEGQNFSKFCIQSTANPFDKAELSTTIDSDNIREILSNKSSEPHATRNTSTDVSRSEDHCSASDGSQWSLKKIMDEYDQKYPDEDEEINLLHNASRYHCDIMNRSVVVCKIEL